MVMRARWRGFELPTTIAVDKDSLTSTYGKFTAEPFERGFGITIGNGLRRVLLSSLEGGAATRVKIDGALHEFASLPGVVQDVTDIVLNVKQLLIKVKSDDPQTITLNVKKQGKVTALDFEPHPLVEVINTGLLICELAEEREFKMEVQVTRGRGYRTAEENDSEDREIGVIPIDSIFSPVSRVRYRTENTRVGQLTDYDKLILEMWTDGTIDPESALVEAGKILRKHVYAFVNYRDLGNEAPAEASFSVESEPEPAQAAPVSATPTALPTVVTDVDLTQRVRDLGLSVRATNALEGHGIESLEDLIAKTDAQLLQIRNFGKTTLQEVEIKLESIQLRLGMQVATA